MSAVVQKYPEEFYRKHDKSWDDCYQENARTVMHALSIMLEAPDGFECFKDAARDRRDIEQRGARPFEPFNESVIGPAKLFDLFRERCPVVIDDERVRPSYDLLLSVAACRGGVFPFSEVSSDLVCNVYLQECCSDQATPLASSLRHTLLSIGSECNALEKHIMSSGTDDQHVVLESLSSQKFKHALRAHLAELESAVGGYVRMIDSMYVTPLLKYGKYSGYLGRTNCRVSNQFNAIVSMVECFLSLEPQIRADTSLGESLLKLSADLLIRLSGGDFDCRALFAPRRGYASQIFLWARSLSRYARRSTRETDRLWERLAALPEKMSRVNPFAKSKNLELLRLLGEVENLKIAVQDSMDSDAMRPSEARLKLDELEELAAVLSGLQTGHMDEQSEICMPPTVERIKGSLACISEAAEELALIPGALTQTRINDLQATLKHHSAKLGHVRDSSLLESEMEVLRKDISLLDVRLKALERACGEVGTDALVVVFVGSVLAMYSVVCLIRKARNS